jgi:hypothetical protein
MCVLVSPGMASPWSLLNVHLESPKSLQLPRVLLLPVFVLHRHDFSRLVGNRSEFVHGASVGEGDLPYL